MAGILDGLKLLASSFSHALSAQQVSPASSSGYSEITEGSSKAGGKGRAETGRQTKCSVASTALQILTNALLLPATSPAEKTQQMLPQEDSTRHLLISSQLSAFQTLSGNLLQTSTNHPSEESSPGTNTSEASTTASANRCLSQPTNRVRHSTSEAGAPLVVVPSRT